eukprot:gene15763-6864_t
MDQGEVTLRTASYNGAMASKGAAKVHPGPTEESEDGNEAVLKEVVVWDSDGKGGVGGDDASKVDEGDDEETRPKVPYS